MAAFPLFLFPFMKKKDIHVAHSPDSDDAFMFYALATKKIDTGDLNYIHLLKDIETLNRRAMKGEVPEPNTTWRGNPAKAVRGLAATREMPVAAETALAA